ncbi:ubiquinol-cytochrome C chaperone family protein [Aureimonas psammosilenae]|uniref:ubiquinol-cytochrome C chaperone family protein n=1 Tax=Aureimonas psammosilenae TaxID=2495496 RepID=UPI0012608C70|nr:ubiquinol-cytochrome C chaperone family protein [Aureimonas psammosilenae]
MTLAANLLSRFKRRHRNREIVDAIYAGIVARSRKPQFFVECGLPDTVMGRFESLSIHVFLFLARCRDERQAAPLAQDLVDRFISDVEDSIREIGIGDVAVPKRMRRLAGLFYERVAGYDAPLRASDADALGRALLDRALKDCPPGKGDAGALANYMIATKAELDAVPVDRLLRGEIFEETA